MENITKEGKFFAIYLLDEAEEIATQR